ncbi:pilus assembly protein PilG [Myxococcaceae bacterium JPH2]|nr:pilus assembly protein PilG [Myxococcaceae bacterium JPH2]
MSKLPALVLPAGLLSLCLLSAPPASALRSGDSPLLPRPGLLRALFRGQLGLVADYFWVLTINRVGISRSALDHRDIYYYADLATDLDPRFAKVYTFAGINIPIHLGREHYANANESTQLLRKGVLHVPEDERTQFQLAYNLMFFHHQYKEAGDIISALSRRPDALPWYSALATRLYAQSGDFDTSMSLAEMMRDSAEDDETRAYFERRIQEILQERVLRQLDSAVAQYREHHGKLPATVEALVEPGLLTQLPEDPLGGHFYLADDGRPYSTASKFRLEVIYDERAADGTRIVPHPHTSETDGHATGTP